MNMNVSLIIIQRKLIRFLLIVTLFSGLISPSRTEDFTSTTSHGTNKPDVAAIFEALSKDGSRENLNGESTFKRTWIDYPLRPVSSAPQERMEVIGKSIMSTSKSNFKNFITFTREDLLQSSETSSNLYHTSVGEPKSETVVDHTKSGVTPRTTTSRSDRPKTLRPGCQVSKYLKNIEGDVLNIGLPENESIGIGFIASHNFPGDPESVYSCKISFSERHYRLLFHEYYATTQLEVELLKRGYLPIKSLLPFRFDTVPVDLSIVRLNKNILKGLRRGYNITFELRKDPPPGYVFNVDRDIRGVGAPAKVSHCHGSGYVIIESSRDPSGNFRLSSSCECLNDSYGGRCQYGATCKNETRDDCGIGFECNEWNFGRKSSCRCNKDETDCRTDNRDVDCKSMKPNISHHNALFGFGEKCEMHQYEFNRELYTHLCRSKKICSHFCHLVPDENIVSIYCSEPPELFGTCEHERGHMVEEQNFSSNNRKGECTPRINRKYPQRTIVGPLGWTYTNSTLTIKCPFANTHPSDTLHWDLDSRQIHPSHRVEIQKGCSESTLIISSFNLFENGRYSCEVRNAGDDTTASSSVLVDVRTERIHISPRKPAIRQGEHISLTCTFLGKPFTWVKLHRFFWSADGAEMTVNWNDDDDGDVLIPTEEGGEWSGQWQRREVSLDGMNKSINVTCRANSSHVDAFFLHSSCIKYKSMNGGYVNFPIEMDVSKTLHVKVFPKHVVACEEEVKFGVFWPLTEVDSASVEDCPLNYYGEATRKCSRHETEDPAWEQPNFTNCLHKVFHDDEKVIRRAASLFKGFDSCRTKSQVINSLISKSKPLMDATGINERPLDLLCKALAMNVRDTKKRCELNASAIFELINELMVETGDLFDLHTLDCIFNSSIGYSKPYYKGSNFEVARLNSDESFSSNSQNDAQIDVKISPRKSSSCGVFGFLRLYKRNRNLQLTRVVADKPLPIRIYSTKPSCDFRLLISFKNVTAPSINLSPKVMKLTSSGWVESNCILEYRRNPNSINDVTGTCDSQGFYSLHWKEIKLEKSPQGRHSPRIKTYVEVWRDDLLVLAASGLCILSLLLTLVITRRFTEPESLLTCLSALTLATLFACLGSAAARDWKQWDEHLLVQLNCVILLFELSAVIQSVLSSRFVNWTHRYESHDYVEIPSCANYITGLKKLPMRLLLRIPLFLFICNVSMMLLMADQTPIGYPYWFPWNTPLPVFLFVFILLSFGSWCYIAGHNYIRTYQLQIKGTKPTFLTEMKSGLYISTFFTVSLVFLMLNLMLDSYIGASYVTSVLMVINTIAMTVSIITKQGRYPLNTISTWVTSLGEYVKSTDKCVVTKESDIEPSNQVSGNGPRNLNQNQETNSVVESELYASTHIVTNYQYNPIGRNVQNRRHSFDNIVQNSHKDSNKADSTIYPPDLPSKAKSKNKNRKMEYLNMSCNNLNNFRYENHSVARFLFRLSSNTNKTLISEKRDHYTVVNVDENVTDKKPGNKKYISGKKVYSSDSEFKHSSDQTTKKLNGNTADQQSAKGSNVSTTLPKPVEENMKSNAGESMQVFTIYSPYVQMKK